MTITPLTASTAAPVMAAKTGAPAVPAPVSNQEIQLALQQPLMSALDAILATARQSAAARQDGLAVLMANALNAVNSAATPDTVKGAVDQLIALHLPTDPAPDAAAVKQALQTSGLFAESNLSSAAAQVPVDMKMALLQLNDAAAGWLARLAVSSDSKQEAVITKSADSSQPAVTGTGVPARDQPIDTPAKAAISPAPRPASATQSQTPAPAGARATPIAAKFDPITAAASKLAAIPQSEPAPAAAAKPVMSPAISASDPAAPSPAAKPGASLPATIEPDTQPAAPNIVVPDAFKPVAKLIRQAIDVLLPETPPSETTEPQASPAAAKSAQVPIAPAIAKPAVASDPRPSPPDRLRNAQGLVQQAVARWPASAPKQDQIAADPALDAMPSFIAAQTFATTPSRPSTPAPVPPQMKALLQLLGKAIAPWLAAPPETASAPSQTPNAGANSAPAPAVSIAQTAPDTVSKSPSAVPASPKSQTEVPAETPRSPSRLPEAKSASPAASAPNPTTAPAASPPITTAAPPSPSPPPPSPPNDVRALLALISKAVEIWSDTSATTPAETASSSRAASASLPSVPPPTPASHPAAQPVSPASLPPNADAADIAKALLKGSDAALARQDLLQIASLPDTKPQGPEARWIFDLPLMTPQGSAVAQLIIEKDGRGSGSEAQKPVWRMQFAIDIEPLGPVRANLALSGERTWVTITADRPESLAKLQGQVSWLADALQSQALDADIAFQSGAGTQVAHRAKSLVDNAS